MFNIFRQIYLKSFFYDKKISKILSKNLQYKPSANLLSSIINIQTKKFNVNDFFLESVWTNKKLNEKQINRLNNFFWLFSLDLKSSNLSVQKIIKNWIEINSKYKPPPISIINNGYPHTKDEISDINLSRSKVTI